MHSRTLPPPAPRSRLSVYNCYEGRAGCLLGEEGGSLGVDVEGKISDSHCRSWSKKPELAEIILFLCLMSSKASFRWNCLVFMR